MSESNVNGDASMKATKNPGKLNTSYWDTAFKEDDKTKPKPKKKKVKKKKSKMASMWENKFEEQKKKVESTAYKPPPKKKVIKQADNTEESTEPTTTTEPDTTTTTNESTATNGDSSTTNGTSTTTTETSATSEPEPKPKPKPKGKVSALAGKIAFNPMAMRGGLPPSLRKKREEAKEKGVELPEQDFARPVIPSSARRKATKKNIIDITNEQINEALRQYLLTTFKFDKYMILSSDNLCAFLRDTADIDLSSTSSDNKWELDVLSSAIKEVFGDEANGSYGYSLRAI